MFPCKPNSSGKCWDYIQGYPTVIVQFACDGVNELKTLQVDTGFSGWFLIDWETYRELGLERSELPEEWWPWAGGFGGGRRLRAAYLSVRLPELAVDGFYVAYSAPGLGRKWNLVGLRFLDQFVRIGDGKQFCLRKKNIENIAL